MSAVTLLSEYFQTYLKNVIKTVYRFKKELILYIDNSIYF